jgi:hypothetical protein
MLAILEGGRTMKIGSIVIRCHEFDRMLAFWQQALHYVPREPVDDGWVVLSDTRGRGPNISLEKVPEPFEPIGKTSRVHLDLYTEDQQGEVERLLVHDQATFSAMDRCS